MTIYKAIKPQAEDAADLAVALVQGKPVSVATDAGEQRHGGRAERSSTTRSP